jgi:hypothetical protein
MLVLEVGCARPKGTDIATKQYKYKAFELMVMCFQPSSDIRCISSTVILNALVFVSPSKLYKDGSSKTLDKSLIS